ncbi:MAG: anthranilate synthase component I family protein [Ginsengibacter sp.]
MTRSVSSYTINNFEQVKAQVLNWLQQFSTFCFLDNQNYPTTSKFQCLAGADIHKKISPATNSFSRLEAFVKLHQDWIFGHFSYDLKNQVEKLDSLKADHIHFPELLFFVPKIVLFIGDSELTIETINENNDAIYAEIIKTDTSSKTEDTQCLQLNPRFSKAEYLATVSRLQEHIHHGDCYEINFCQEFFANGFNCNPVKIFKSLSAVSANPFSCLYTVENSWLLCASPERYLKKTGDQIISQPIKGTASRINYTDETDEQDKLRQSKKDKSENVMIVDLVRNDLSKICTEGSVHVQELFGIYSFPQVHQMISTVAGTLKDQEDYSQIFKATFPMGSMTGAPKIKVMQLIEKYERSKRGIFSGAVGYFSPEGDFDFNVVIRSMMYNAATKYMCIMAGSAITGNSIPEEEYEECLVKIKGLLKALHL